MSASEHLDAVDLAHESDFLLGSLLVKPSSRTVAAAGVSELLEPRVMQVLVALVRRRGTVVSRDELINECWAGRVVGDDAISRCIIRLRRLAETHGGFVLETIPRVGYRLVENRAEALAVVTPASTEVVASSVSRRSYTSAWVLAGVALIILIAAAFGTSWWRAASEARAKQDEILSRVIALVAKDQFAQAFTAARPLLNDARIRQLPEFAAAWKQVVLPMRPVVAEVGANVFFKSYDDVGEWISIGTIPLPELVEAPRGVLRIKVEKPGFRTGYFVVANPGPSVENKIRDPFFVNRKVDDIALPLLPNNAIPDDMVVVPRTNIPVQFPGWTKDPAGSFKLDLPAFAIDREEVTNRQYKEFVDAGGYADPKYWEGLQFEVEHRAISWQEVRKRFVDTTGRAGPAGWQLSTFQSDEADFPVGGISWYEAAAYARFKGRQLPTIHHWVRAALAPYDAHFNVSPAVALTSQFDAKGPRKAHDEIGLGPWGTIQMAGNVREWIWNSADGKGLALGGAWADYASDNKFAYSADRMQRLPENGVRLMKTLSEPAPGEELLGPIDLAIVASHANRNPVSNDAFDAMRFQFNTARKPLLAAKVEIFEETSLWVAEEVVLHFEKSPPVNLYIVRPKTHAARLQPIIFGPAQTCCISKRPNRNTLEQLRVSEFVANSGRALVMPIWMGSYERFVPSDPDPKVMSDRQGRVVLAWHEDIREALDYLETRDDIDSQKIGYFGISRGAAYNAIVLAIEDRVKAAVLVSGGVDVVQNVHPMADIANYAPRIKIPVLLINGRFDHIYLLNESQKRLLNLLGTPADMKQHNLYETGHYNYPPNTTARDVTDWFDRYLGAVQ